MSWQDQFAKLAAAKASGAAVSTKAGVVVVAPQRVSLALEDADVIEIIKSHRGERQPKRREWIVKKYRSYLENHRVGKTDQPAKNHHDAGYACCAWAWREILGGYIAGDFIPELSNVFYDSFDPALGDRIPPGNEFATIIFDSLAAVLGELAAYNPDNPNDPDDPAIQKYLRDRANRNFGSHHLDEINTAPVLDDSAFSMNGQGPKFAAGSKANAQSSAYDPWDGVETSDEIWAGIEAMIADEAGSHSNGKDKTKSDPIFREYGPTEWAKPVERTSFFIKQALCTDTWGVNGGPEKSLKTHDNFAIGMSIATGINLYRSDLLPVLRQGKALLIVGEGGEKQILRLLHRMCRAYGIKVEDVLNDPLFPLVVEFGVAPLNSDRLRDEIKELLDRHQPDYVSMESFYNFHPVEVSAANLYERGQVIDSYHKLVRESGNDVVSMLTDHNKKGANELGLRHISMSGQAENSDSWIQRIHRREPDVVDGEFCLTTSFNSRNWGGSTFDVDWHLGPFDHDAGCHTGDISWDVCPNKAAAGGGTDSGVKLDVGILVRDNPWKFNRQEIFEKLRPVRKQDVYTAIKEMVDEGELNEESPKLHGHGGKAVVIGPGPGLAALIGKVVAHGGGRTP